MRSPITLRGAEKLRAELRKLKAEDRPAIIRAIAEARSHGDLSENAEYHAAREQQGFIEGRIKEIEQRLADAQVIDPATLPDTGKVVFGATVTLADTDSGDNKKYMLVGQEEADFKKGKISIQSPVGKALIGHKVGDVVTIKTPAKTVEYEIQEIVITLD